MASRTPRSETKRRGRESGVPAAHPDTESHAMPKLTLPHRGYGVDTAASTC